MNRQHKHTHRFVDLDVAFENATACPPSYDATGWGDYDDIDAALCDYRFALDRLTELQGYAALLYGGGFQIPDYGIELDIELAELEVEKLQKLVDRLFEIDAKLRIEHP